MKKTIIIFGLTLGIMSYSYCDPVVIKSKGISGNITRSIITDVEKNPGVLAGLDVVPFSVDDGLTLDVSNNPYTLKEGSGGGYSGNFQALDFDDSGGAALYQSRIINGYQGDFIVPGDNVTTEPGNMVNPTINGMNTRLAGNTTVLIPVIDLDLVSGKTTLPVIDWAVFELIGVTQQGPGLGFSVVEGNFVRIADPVLDYPAATQESFDVKSRIEANQ